MARESQKVENHWRMSSHVIHHVTRVIICVEAGERLLLCGDVNSGGRINDTLTDTFNTYGLHQYIEVLAWGDNILDVLADDDRMIVNDK